MSVNLADVGRLLALTPLARSNAFQPRRSNEAIYRGALVLACAAWEALVEDLAIEAMYRLASRYDDGGEFAASGQEVAVRASKAFQRANIEPKSWGISPTVRDKLLGPFNTPKAENVNTLMRRTLDIGRFADAWGSQRVTAASVARRLDRMVEVRGNIAHRVKASVPYGLGKRDVQDDVQLIETLALRSTNRIRNYLVGATGDAPWDVLPVRLTY